MRCCCLYEGILLKSHSIYRKEGDSSLMIVDFGIAKHLHGEDEVRRSDCA